jgi:hypothetical protein
MSLKFSDKPQLRYGAATSRYDVQLPAGSQPIASAPKDTATPIIVYARDNKGGLEGRWALHHNGAWRQLAPFKDFKTGAVSWRMNGDMISNPIAWSLPRKK